MFKKVFQLFNDVQKMDPAMSQALANIRSGKGTPQDASVLARGMYTDTMVPKMGNKMAYGDFLTRNANKGIHVHVDMNDFGQINKYHGEKMGDHAIKQFGSTASEVSRLFGGKAFRNGGDEFKFWFHKPEHAHAFARELRSRLEKHPKVGGTHNLAASIGIGFNRDHAEGSLLEAKKQLGPTDPTTGKRKNLHSVGDAPTVIHSKTHEAPPPTWKPSAGMPKPVKATDDLSGGLKFHNPLNKNSDGAAKSISQPIPTPSHSIFEGGRVGIMTAEAPYHPVAKVGGNPALEMELRRRGLKYEKATGKYEPGKTENSFVIHDIDHKQMAELGTMFGQDSVLHSHKGQHRLIYTNGDKKGQFHTGTGHTIHENEPSMYYSTVHHNGKPVHFTLNLDFDRLHSPPGSNQKRDVAANADPAPSVKTQESGK